MLTEWKIKPKNGKKKSFQGGMRYERYADEFAAIMCQNFQIIILENENLISVAIYSIRHLCNEIFLLRLLDMSGMKANEKIVKNKKTVEPEGRKKKTQKVAQHTENENVTRFHPNTCESYFSM